MISVPTISTKWSRLKLIIGCIILQITALWSYVLCGMMFCFWYKMQPRIRRFALLVYAKHRPIGETGRKRNASLTLWIINVYGQLPLYIQEEWKISSERIITNLIYFLFTSVILYTNRSQLTNSFLKQLRSIFFSLLLLYFCSQCVRYVLQKKTSTPDRFDARIGLKSGLLKKKCRLRHFHSPAIRALERRLIF